MKRIKLFCLLFLSVALSACEFNQSIHKDLTTGALSRGNGIGCDDVKIQVNGKIDNRNSFVAGEKINFVFNNVTGLKRKNGKVFPGLSIFVVKNGKDTLLRSSDLFADLKNGTDLSPLQLQANFVSAFPHKNNEKYTVHIKIWDKKGKGTFDYELPFSVKENKLLNIKNKGINYATIYLWDETKQQVIVDKEVAIENTLILILEGLEGLKAIDNKVYPSFSIEIIDSKGRQVLSKANILEKYKDVGVDVAEFKKGQLPVTITFTSGMVDNPCQLKASLTDLNSNKRIDIKSTLIIE